MNKHIQNPQQTWWFTKTQTVKQGWDLFFYTLRYEYKRALTKTEETNWCGENLQAVSQDCFWLALSGYEADF